MQPQKRSQPPGSRNLRRVKGRGPTLLLPLAQLLLRLLPFLLL